MSMKKGLIFSMGPSVALAVVAAALSATSPPAAIAAPAASFSTGQAAISATDVSAARRRHHARTAPREAFGSISGGSATYGAPSYQGYGYGYGDNSHNQTW
jgi:hypothetical protein